MVLNHDLKIGSLNVRGLNENLKRQAIFTWANKNKFDILFLQETYSSIDIQDKWKHEWGGTSFMPMGQNIVKA